MYRDRTLPRFTVHLLYTYCTLTVHLLYTTGFVYTCTVNWFCVCLYSKLVFCTLHWQLKDVRWNSVLGTHRQSNRHSNICTSRAASSQLKIKSEEVSLSSMMALWIRLSRIRFKTLDIKMWDFLLGSANFLFQLIVKFLYVIKVHNLSLLGLVHGQARRM